MDKAQLIKSIRAKQPHSPEWMEAVRALGRYSKLSSPEPAPATRRGRPTGRDYWQTIWGITRSHHFTEAEREAYRERAAYERGSEVLYKEITTTVAARQRAETTANRAAKAALETA